MTTSSRLIDRPAAETSEGLEALDSPSRRARRLKSLADTAADEVARSGRPVALAAMADGDRELVREHLRWRLDLVARSAGDGSERHVVLIPI